MGKRKLRTQHTVEQPPSLCLVDVGAARRVEHAYEELAGHRRSGVGQEAQTQEKISVPIWAKTRP